MKLTAEDYFGRVSHVAEPDETVKANAGDLLVRVNSLLDVINRSFPGIEAAMKPHVTSGWRPASYNATVPGAAAKSKHITGQAVDLADPDGELDELLFAHQNLLELAGLWMEHPLATKNWTHLSSVPPRSNRRVFYP